MAAELFEKICAAEEKADVIVQKAYADARELLKQTETDCARAERQAAGEFRQLLQERLEQNRAQVAEELEQKSAEARKTLVSQMDEARKRLGGAVKLVTERVLNDGNS